MEKKMPVAKILSLLVLAYGIIMILISQGGIRFYSSEMFRDMPKLIFVAMMFSLGLICIISGVGVLLLKQWGRKLLLIICPLILVVYFLLILVKSIEIDFITILLLLIPFLFIYFFTRPKVKEQFSPPTCPPKS